MLFLIGDVRSVFRETPIKLLYKKGDKSDCRSCLVWFIFRLRMTVDKVLRVEQFGFSKGSVYVDQICPLRVIIKNYLSYKTPLVFTFIDYKQVFNSTDRRALVKALSFYSIPDKYIKVTSVMHKNNMAAWLQAIKEHGLKQRSKFLLELHYADDLIIKNNMGACKVGYEVIGWFRIKSGVYLSGILSHLCGEFGWTWF